MPAGYTDDLRNFPFPEGKEVAGLTPVLTSKILTTEEIGWTEAARHFHVLESPERPALLPNGVL